MRRGQVTLFIIAGIVVVITVLGAVWFIGNTNSISVPEDVAVKDDTKARGCLQQSTIQALGALHDDGIVTAIEGGVLPDTTHTYLTQNGFDVVNAYWGLCDTQLQNQKQADGSFSCNWRVYNLFAEQSIQSQLQMGLNRHMNQCVGQNQPGTAELIIREEGVLATWDNPRMQYTHTTPLHLVHTAVEEMMRREVTEPSFNLANTPLQCDKCDAVVRTAEPVQVSGGIASNYINWTLVVDDQLITRIALPRRGVVLESTTTGARTASATSINCDAAGTCSHRLLPLDDTSIQLSVSQTRSSCPTGEHQFSFLTAPATTSGPLTLSVTPGLQGQSVDLTYVEFVGAQPQTITISLTGTGGACP